MRILITGATGNVGKGMVERLRRAGHDVVLHDLVPAPDSPDYSDLPYFQGDLQAGVGIDRAAMGCDLILHTPAWHGIHWRAKTEVDFWRLNVDGTFWMFQAARAAGIRRVVFLSSMAWHGQYDKYGFTKRVGEELCEFNRRNHGVRYVAVRPYDFTPWGSDFANRYGARLLYGGVDRDDVLDCIERSVETLAKEGPDKEPEAIVAVAGRANAFSEVDVADWEADPVAACDRIFPGSRPLIEKYALNIQRKPGVIDLGETSEQIGYRPKRHFGTFLEELGRIDAEGGREAVAAVRCPY